MTTPIIPQELYLLERYSSPEYFLQMRDAWDAMLAYVEDCLERFMHDLPDAYRGRPLPEQPDIVWGQRILPNFRDTQNELHEGYRELLAGDANGLGAAYNVSNDIRGQREFSYDWLDELQSDGSDRYFSLLHKAGHFARNIAATLDASWCRTELTTDYDQPSRGELNGPLEWPAYRSAHELKVRTDDFVPKNGLYLPDAPDSCAQYLVRGQEAPPANIGYDLETFQNVSEASTTWTLVERVAGGTVPLEEGLGRIESTPSNVAAGEPCPREGWWFTPATAGSSHHFKQGELFPVIEGSDYGSTYWQWSPNQSTPRL